MYIEKRMRIVIYDWMSKIDLYHGPSSSLWKYLTMDLGMDYFYKMLEEYEEALKIRLIEYLCKNIQID